MSEFKGTKGTWARIGNAVFNDDGYDIFHLTYGEYTGIKEDEANTNLIAAAPELLEALQKLISDYDRYKSATLIEKTELETLPLKAARAAIAKALGQ